MYSVQQTADKKYKVLYEDDNLLAIDKPAGITVYPENQTNEKTLIDYLLDDFPYLKDANNPPRYGIIHRLDKDTSGIILAAKSKKSFDFFQKEFAGGADNFSGTDETLAKGNRSVVKKYLALAVGELKEDRGTIDTLIGRSKNDRRKQKAYFPGEPGSEGKRRAITEYKVLERFKDYTLVEVLIKTGRKHQIRAHFVYLGHPIAGDKLYGFKRQPCPKGLNRQFLHAFYLKIRLLGGKIKEFKSELPDDLKKTLESLKNSDY